MKERDERNKGEVRTNHERKKERGEERIDLGGRQKKGGDREIGHGQ